MHWLCEYEDGARRAGPTVTPPSAHRITEEPERQVHVGYTGDRYPIAITVDGQTIALSLDEFRAIARRYFLPGQERA